MHPTERARSRALKPGGRQGPPSCRGGAQAGQRASARRAVFEGPVVCGWVPRPLSGGGRPLIFEGTTRTSLPGEPHESPPPDTPSRRPGRWARRGRRPGQNIPKPSSRGAGSTASEMTGEDKPVPASPLQRTAPWTRARRRGQSGFCSAAQRRWCLRGGRKPVRRRDATHQTPPGLHLGDRAHPRALPLLGRRSPRLAPERNRAGGPRPQASAEETRPAPALTVEEVQLHVDEVDPNIDHGTQLQQAEKPRSATHSRMDKFP